MRFCDGKTKEHNLSEKDLKLNIQSIHQFNLRKTFPFCRKKIAGNARKITNCCTILKRNKWSQDLNCKNLEESRNAQSDKL